MDEMNVIILAGGNSSRFGIPKPFLLFEAKITFLEKIVNVYMEFGCKKITLVLNQSHAEQFSNTFSKQFRSQIRVIYNNKTGLGRFYSLKLGANTVSNSDYCFIQNIDNPFTDTETLQKLYGNRNDEAYISPVYLNRGGHPILLPAMIIDLIKKETDFSLNTRNFLSGFNKITVEVDSDKILANINTPEDYFRLFLRRRESIY
jgi:molybdenum cofactor cytidylyltransferase